MAAKTRQKSWWIPYIFVGGFGIVFSVNMVLLYFAVTTFTGLETTQAYVEGLEYNDRIAEEQAQEALGWKADVVLEIAPGQAPDPNTLMPLKRDAVPTVHIPTDLKIAILDAGGKRISGVKVEAEIRRPTLAGFDQQALLVEDLAHSHIARVELPAYGQWDVLITARQGDGDPDYRLRRRFVLEP